MNKNKGAVPTWLTIMFLVLGGLSAITISWRIYKIRDKRIAPNAPEQVPAADGASSQCTLNFVVPTSAPEPTATSTPTLPPGTTPTATNTPTVTPTATPTATNTPTLTPTNTPTTTPEPTATNTPTPEPEATNTPTPEPGATNTPTPEPEATNTPAPVSRVAEATDTPTPTRVELPTAGETDITSFSIIFGGLSLILGLLLAL